MHRVRPSDVGLVGAMGRRVIRGEELALRSRCGMKLASAY
jgi:hypothetical protein